MASRKTLNRCATTTLGDKSLLRGTTKAVLLEGFGRRLRGTAGGIGFKGGHADREYEKSFEVTELDIFLSHSWHAWWLLKYLTLLLYFNTLPAVCASLTSGAVATYVYHGGDFAEKFKDVTNAAMAMGIPVFVIVLFSWHHIVAFFGVWNPSMFLDKVCIHQRDPARKANGIRSIGAILHSTDQVLVTWDSTYFERLWCTFELAAFKYGRSQGRIVLLPITLGGTLTLISIAYLATELARIYWITHFASDSESATSIHTYTAIWYVCNFFLSLGFMHEVRIYARDLKDLTAKLSSFSVRDAKCFCCCNNHELEVDGQKIQLTCDRDLVEASIAHWFGEDHRSEGLDKFDRLVQVELSRDFQACISGVSKLPYVLVLGCMVWNSLLWLDSVHTVLHNVPAQLTFVVVMAFCIGPSSIAIVGFAGQLLPMPHPSPGEELYLSVLKFCRHRLEEVCLVALLNCVCFANDSLFKLMFFHEHWLLQVAGVVLQVAMCLLLFHKDGNIFMMKSAEKISYAFNPSSVQELEMASFGSDGVRQLAGELVPAVTEREA